MKIRNFKLNEEGLFSITRPYEAHQIIKIIESLISDKILSELVITDATASMGGDLINFSKKVKFVNGVEINPENFAILQQNCCSFGCKNVNLFCQDYTAIYDKLKQDIIYIDPPWGGIGYKSKEFVSLKLGGMELYELINLITIKSLAKFVIIKAPLNVCLDQIDYGHITVVYNKSRVPTFKIICVNVLKQCLKSKHLK